MEPNTASKVSGCFIGIPGKRQAQPAQKGEMHLAKVVADLHFVLSEWWNSNARPRIANSDRSFWGMLDASEVLRRIHDFLNKDHCLEADVFLLCYSGHGSRDGGKWCCDGSYVTFEQVIDLWQKSAVCRDGHRLILYVDACYSGHWALKAQQMSLPNVIVQTSCSDAETSLDGVFTKAFVDFQNSAVRPCNQQLYSRTPYVYVPWPEGEKDTVIYKNSQGRANRSRPYMHLLFEPDHVYRLNRKAAAAAAEAQRRRDAEAMAAADAKRKLAQAAAAAEAQRVLSVPNCSGSAAVAPSLQSPQAASICHQTPQTTHHMMREHNQSTIAGIQWAATHDYPNEDLNVTGAAGGWPSRLFGTERSRALIASGVTTFSQLMAEVKSRTREEFYKTFGTCDGKVGILDTAANIIWEVCMAWNNSCSDRRRLATVMPLKSLKRGETAALPAKPHTAQRPGPAQTGNRNSALNALLNQMQIDFEFLRNAAAGKSASQHGLNMPEIKHVLNYFNVDSSGKREDLNMKLSNLLTSIRAQ